MLSAAVSQRSNLMEPDEVIARLKDRILQHSAAMLDSFHEFANPSTQRLSRRDFRRVRPSFAPYFDMISSSRPDRSEHTFTFTLCLLLILCF